MKKIHRCKKCDCIDDTSFICDTCEESVAPYELCLLIGGSANEYHFCNYQCLLKFIVEELKKESPTDERFIYGKKRTER